MTKKEINACLGWCIRHGKGFFYNGKRYSAITFHDDYLEVHTSDINSITYIPYKNIVSIKNIAVNGALQKTIFIK